MAQRKVHTDGESIVTTVSYTHLDVYKRQVLQETPFTDKGSVVEIFTDLTVWMGIRKVIDQINANAVA